MNQDPHPRIPFAGYEARILLSDFTVFKRGTWREIFSVPITLDESRALRDMWSYRNWRG